ncbi:hypothetical protein C1I95_24740 [Micromonospora craterilacus]|uniref:Uncharacterized protein n=1 Tax=Micromonospora craterilacus TaxID=1655439 RepID=A0A2W2DQN1_9ACTN|nr:hypothetical protein [Micromonospora craterilacus]PZG12953.1 hypothetical protein C1I95_24740 [Micromonospora craterilacus]
MITLPDPDCRYGYTVEQLEAILGDRLDAFGRWIDGQTISLCTGSEFDNQAKGNKPTGCGPHGSVVYGSDLRRFLAGRRSLD